jgi:hypothetical protein
MTPKEKAEELINNFRDFADGTCPETDRYSPKIEKQKAKQCAIIAVNEIIKFGNLMGIREPMMYWNKVKEEIEKL